MSEMRKLFEEWAKQGEWTDQPFDRIDDDGEIADYDAPDYDTKDYLNDLHNAMWSAWQAATALCVSAERERCAKIADNDWYGHGLQIAAAIRARTS